MAKLSTRYGEPEEVAHVTLGLVLPAASYITAYDAEVQRSDDGRGAVMPVDGGLLVQST